jgi:hypothetical protein
MPYGRLGQRKTAVGLRPLYGFYLPHFVGPANATYAFAYMGGQNVANSHNVIGLYRNFFKIFFN